MNREFSSPKNEGKIFLIDTFVFVNKFSSLRGGDLEENIFGWSSYQSSSRLKRPSYTEKFDQTTFRSGYISEGDLSRKITGPVALETY